MASPFRHVLCPTCYQIEEPGRSPVLINDAEPERCCRCSESTDSPVFYRHEPYRFKCHGKHGEEA